MDDTDCSICLEPLDDYSLLFKPKLFSCCKSKHNNIKIVRLHCGHKFHSECIKEITNRKCAVCRQTIHFTHVCHANHLSLPSYNRNGKCRVCSKYSFKFALHQIAK